MNSGRRYQRHFIYTYLRAVGLRRDAGLPTKLVEDGQGGQIEFVDIDATIDLIVEYLDAQAITPERFRQLSYGGTRHAIEEALRAVTGGKAPE